MDANDFTVSFLEAHRIRSMPASFYYIPEFITEAEEKALLSKINNPQYPTTTPWIHLRNRRLQAHPARLTASNTLLASTPLASWLTEPCIPRFAALGVFAGHTPHGTPNHCLINEYAQGQGIMPHEDGAAYAPVVATVTLGSEGVLEVFEKSEDGAQENHGDEPGEHSGGEQDRSGRRPRWRVLQERRSLLVTRGNAYRDLLHGIAETKMDTHLFPAEELEAESQGNENDASNSDGQEFHIDAFETACLVSQVVPGIANWELLGNPTRFTTGGRIRGTRISLTWRDVLKVSKVGERLFGRR